MLVSGVQQSEPVAHINIFKYLVFELWEARETQRREVGGRLPWWSSGWGCALPLQGARVPPLV